MNIKKIHRAYLFFLPLILPQALVGMGDVELVEQIYEAYTSFTNQLVETAEEINDVDTLEQLVYIGTVRDVYSEQYEGNYQVYVKQKESADHNAIEELKRLCTHLSHLGDEIPTKEIEMSIVNRLEAFPRINEIEKRVYMQKC